jgi:Ni,Fe-hydrogenase I cytochrome b subunit
MTDLTNVVFSNSKYIHKMFIKKWQLVSSLVILLLAASGFCWWKLYLYPKQTLFQTGKIAENFRSILHSAGYLGQKIIFLG